MDADILLGKWEQLKGKAKVQWAKLTDDHILKINGNRQQLIGYLQELYGRTRDEAEKEIEDWLSNV